MVPVIDRLEWKRFRWAAVVCAIIFIVIQVFPMTEGGLFETSEEKAIDKSEAEKAAVSFAEKTFGMGAASAHTVHQSDSMVYGYLSKHNLIDDYEDKYGLLFPTDTYQSEISLIGLYTVYVYTHMETGRIVGWHVLDVPADGTEEAVREAAVRAATGQGLPESALKEGRLEKDGTYVLQPEGYAIGEAPLKLSVRLGRLAKGEPVVTEYAPKFEAPSGYRSYVEEQKQLADSLSTYGFLMMSGFLFVLAIIYSIVYARHTSFRRGMLVSALFLVMYLANNFNMLDGIRASLGETEDADSAIAVMAVVSAVITLLLGLSVYFSLVAGDGMWRSLKRSIWYGFRERGYGEHVWRSAWLSYLLAIIMLGLQSVILLILQLVTGAWATSDVTQSTYNMALPLLLPLMAWCAAISEEAIFRLFGIAIMKRWFKNMFVAILIPTVIWALGHVAYPIFPSTTRLFELIVIGFVFALIFLRYGFVTAVFTHAIFDTILMSMSLMFMGGAVNIVAALFYLALPALVAWVIRYWHRTRFPKLKAGTSTQ